MPDKINLTLRHKALFNPSAKEPCIVDVPEFQFLCLDGYGNPATDPIYAEILSALYSVAYALKFAVKKQLGINYAVMPLEGLWWMADGSIVSDENKDHWSWTMMIQQPEWVTPGLLEQVLLDVRKKKDLAHVDEVRLEPFHEGLSVQLLHLGRYTEEHENIMRMHAYAYQQGYVLRDKHHEIYLNDPRLTAPERLRTVLRQPIARPAV